MNKCVIFQKQTIQQWYELTFERIRLAEDSEVSIILK